MDFVYALILGIVEGLTEFLPISSTGHLLVVSALLQFPTSIADLPARLAYRGTFDIFIQFGAIIAIFIYFARDLLKQAQKLPTDRNTQRFWLNIVIAIIPAVIVGLLFRNQIKTYLFNPVVIGLALIVGGIIFLIVESRERPSTTHSLETVTPLQALWIGIAQLFSLIPGTSRSGASIIGGMLTGLDRQIATTFSFYLAIPALGLATVYDLVSSLREGIIQSSDLPVFLIGMGVSFVMAYASIAWLLWYVATHNFRAFGIYRIIAGAIILVLALFTQVLSF
jgi:undecaprenyl-diphosphatase